MDWFVRDTSIGWSPIDTGAMVHVFASLNRETITR